MGAIDEQTRNNVAIAFTGILRGSAMASGMDMQRVALALHTIFEHTEEGQPVDLGAMYFYLVHEAKQPESAAIEALVVLKSREARFPGVQLQLPAAAAELTEEQIASIVERYNARSGEKAKTYERKEAPSQTLSPSYQTPTARPSKGPTLSRQTKLVITLAVALVGTVGSFVFNTTLSGPPLVQVNFPVDSAGLPCAQEAPPMANGVARCIIPKALFDKEGRDGIRGRADITKRALRAQGVKDLLIITKEDHKMRMIF